MIKILKGKNLNIRQQYTIPDCKYKYRLRFDAFDIDNNIAFEYNGEQHYRPIDFHGKGKERAEKDFELTKKRDKAKVEYCKSNNIPLVIIPYWEYKNMESIITENLEKIGVK